MPEKPWPILVLTLEGDEGRRSDLVEALKRLSLDFELFFGVDGRSGLPENYEAIVDRDLARKKYRRDLGDPEFACALSHREIYRTMIENGWEGAIVFEDDAVLTDDFAEFVNERLYEKADMIMMDHSHARVWGPEIVLSENIRARKLSLPSARATGYSVSARAARYLLDAGTPMSDIPDWPGDVTDVGAIACVPTIIKHQDPITGPSHLRRDRHKPKRDPLRFFRWTTWKRWITKRLSTRVS